jgi:addiction module RelB/DinJ family antitoxin
MATISVRVEDSLKSEVERKLKQYGLNFSSAINIYLSKINDTNRIPFVIGEDDYDDTIENYDWYAKQIVEAEEYNHVHSNEPDITWDELRQQYGL